MQLSAGAERDNMILVIGFKNRSKEWKDKMVEVGSCLFLCPAEGRELCLLLACSRTAAFGFIVPPPPSARALSFIKDF